MSALASAYTDPAYAYRVVVRNAQGSMSRWDSKFLVLQHFSITAEGFVREVLTAEEANAWTDEVRMCMRLGGFGPHDMKDISITMEKIK